METSTEAEFWGRLQRNNQEAVRLFRLAAEEGAMEAQRVLGQRYEFGQGVRVDCREAVGCYRQAAAQGDVESAVRLGNSSFWAKVSQRI